MRLFNKIGESFKSPHFLFLVGLTLLANLLLLSNILQSDYFGDDLYNFQVPGKIPHEYASITAYAVACIKGWMSVGRFFPISAGDSTT